MGNTIGKLLDDIFTTYADAAKKLKARPANPSTLDMTDQLARLVSSGFVATTPYPVLKEFPRYLKALLYRLEKAAQDTGRDQRLMAEVVAFWQPYWDWIKQGKSNIAPERDGFRWMLEEFRVSIFAQAIRTPYPVSAKRLSEAWATKIRP